MISWLDILFTLIFAGCVGLGGHRRLSGLLIGVGSALLVRPLLTLADISGLLAFIAALVAGALLALLARLITPKLSGGYHLFSALGLAGGAVFGLALIMALAVSFPIDSQDGQYVFAPSSQRPLGFVMEESQRSQLVTIGRYALFYEYIQQPPEGVNWQLVGAVHRGFVANLPWE